MSQTNPFFQQGGEQKGYTGLVLIAQDLPTTQGQVFAFANARVVPTRGDNNAYPPLIDNSSEIHNKVPGARLGTLDLMFALQLDRAVHTFLTQAFGKRTGGKLTPFIVQIIPYSGAGTQTLLGVYFARVTIGARFSVQGAGAQIMVRVQAIVCDPDNVGGFVGPLATPSTTALDGAGISSFVSASFTDGGASPVVYNGIQSFSFTLDNSMSVNPSYMDKVHRLVSGCTPGAIRGAVSLDQNLSSSSGYQVVPSTGKPSLNLILPTGDQTHALTIATSLSYDSDGTNLVPDDFLDSPHQYSLFSENANNATGNAAAISGSTNFPFVATYA